MKKIYLVLLSIFVIIGYASSQCPDNLILETQQQIDDFPLEYPNCTEIDGFVIINGQDITNLLGLNALTAINDFVSINETSLSDFSGLDNLTSIGGYLSIIVNSHLTSLTGLENLTNISDFLAILDNDSLISLAGLEGLNNVEGFQFGIKENDALVELTTFNDIEYLEGSLIIENNSSLININGLDSLAGVGGSITINNCISLTNLAGLSGLTTIAEDLKLSKIYFAEELLGFENLTSIGGDLLINKCNSLTDLAELIKLESIGGSLEISENNALESLLGLDSINSESIMDLTIKFNPLLSYCNVQSVCNYLADPNGNISIYNNSSGCNNYLEVENACAVKVDENTQKEEFSFFPNPVNDKLFITGNNRCDKFNLKIFNQLGLEIISENKFSNSIDLSSVQPGLYIIEIITGISNYREILIIQ